METRDLASIRGRAGVAANNWLFYGTVGWGRGKARVGTELDEGPPNAEFRSVTGKGMVYGAGVEWAFWQNWSLRAEYLRYNLRGSTDFDGRRTEIRATSSSSSTSTSGAWA